VLAMAPVAWMKRAESRVGVEQLAEHKPLAAREPVPLAALFYLKIQGFRSSRIPQAPSGLQRRNPPGTLSPKVTWFTRIFVNTKKPLNKPGKPY